MNGLLSPAAAAACAPAAAGLDWVIAHRAARIPLSGVELDQADAKMSVPTTAGAGVAGGSRFAGATTASGSRFATTAGRSGVATTAGATAAGGNGVTTSARRRVRSITGRRPLVVAAAAALAAAQAAHSGPTWLLPPQLVLIAGLVALAAGDVEWLLLPKGPVWWTTAATGATMVAGAAATGAWHRFDVAVVFGLGAAAVLAAVSIANPRWMGFGDVRLALPIGLVLAWSGGAGEVVVGLFLANVLAALTGVLLLATRRAGLATALPFGMFLAVGSVATLLLSR